MKNPRYIISPRASLAWKDCLASIALAILSCFLFLTAATEAASLQKQKPQTQKGKAAPETNKPQPRLSISKTEQDFGEVFAGELLEHVFAVLNTGAAPLELYDGGPVGALENVGPETPFRTVSFKAVGVTPINSFILRTAATRAAPS